MRQIHVAAIARRLGPANFGRAFLPWGIDPGSSRSRGISRFRDWIHLPSFSSIADVHRARERAAPDVRELSLAFRTTRTRARVAEAGRPRGSARSFPFQALRRRAPAGCDRAESG